MHNSNVTYKRSSIILIISSILLIFMFQTALTVPLSPEVVEQLRESGQLQTFIDRMALGKTKGVCQPFSHDSKFGQQSLSLNANALDTFRVVVILADFSDNPVSGGGITATVGDFEHLLFSNDSTDGHYSMTEFFYDNSYGDFILEGVVAGWFRLPETYDYYVAGNNGFGSYPHNAQRMAEDAITAADPSVDFSQFDNDNNGTADGVFIVHAGPGAESTGSDNHIWSHAWGLSSNMFLDGIFISGYTTEPEEMSSQLITQGVFSHEYGHFLGLPDLYDTDYSSSGVGKWSLMAGGSWNSNGRYPAFLDAWCKKELGFITLTNISPNQTNLEIPSSYHNPTAFRLWENGMIGQQYFIIENRQNTGKDTGIPGSGLLIAHIDESQWGNSDETHYLVGIEQADNLNHLENGSNSGDGGDVWSSATKTEFSKFSQPNTNKYNGSPTNVLVWDISASDSIMYANLDISYSAPKFSVTTSQFSDSLYGNNNGVVEIGETITFEYTLNNLWLTASNVTGEMIPTNGDITFSTSSSNIGTILGEGGSGSNNSSLLVFDIPISFDPCVDSFFLNVTSDNYLGDITFGFELHVGTPDVVIIDDDDGADWEQHVVTTLQHLRIPHDVYDKSQLGAPSIALLDDYEIVIWITGDDRPNIFSPADISAMQSFMDLGRNMMLSSQSAASELSSDNLTFLNDYFKADYDADLLYPLIIGQPGSVIGDGTKLRYDSWTNQLSPEKMFLYGGDGVSEFELPVGGVLGITYDGAYKSFITSFGFEGISNGYESQGYSTQDSVLARVMKFFDYGAVNKFSNPYVDTIQLPNESSITSVVNSTPTFHWNFSDTTGSTQLQYQIQVGSGNLCINSNDMWDSGPISGVEDSAIYNGSILEEGATYYIRIRVYNGTEWSSWRRTTFTMNMAPEAGTLVYPIDNIHLSTDLPELIVNNGSDANGDAITYDFEVYDDVGLTNLITSTTSVIEGIGTTSWFVDVPLAEDILFYWRSRANDGAEYGDYSETGSFYVNQFNQAPNSFGLLLPADTAEYVGVTPTFVWNSTTDADAGDEVAYTLVYSDDSLFAISTIVNRASDTTFNVSSPLVDKETYYWKVYAKDLANDSTWSTDTYIFNTDKFGCCEGFRGNINFSVDDEIDISDLIFMIGYMFQEGDAPLCFDEANVNGLAEIDISDLIILIGYMFQEGPPPADCP